jgi:dienelactone hydrolase
MMGFLARPLDRLAIRGATASVAETQRSRAPAAGGVATLPEEKCSDIARVEELLREPDLFKTIVDPAPDLTFQSGHVFQFTSPVDSPWPENKIVHGKFYRAGKDWRSRPSVILLHGWNGELGYWRQFPFLAWRFNRRGVNAAMFELPYHAQRKPQAPGAIRNFISHDLVRMVEATQQALADAAALCGWLQEQGSPCVGVWGISLGAWLAGLLACHESRLAAALLMTPVNRMDRAIRELEFCAPIRQSLGAAPVPLRKESFERLNLLYHRPLMPPEKILLVQSRYDLFAPPETVEELWRGWGHPQIWRVRHGHISILMSLPVMERAVRWLSAQLTTR